MPGKKEKEYKRKEGLVSNVEKILFILIIMTLLLPRISPYHTNK
jgi:cell division protein FtsL